VKQLEEIKPVAKLHKRDRKIQCSADYLTEIGRGDVVDVRGEDLFSEVREGMFGDPIEEGLRKQRDRLRDVEPAVRSDAPEEGFTKAGGRALIPDAVKLQAFPTVLVPVMFTFEM
jgi:hypothetical protein